MPRVTTTVTGQTPPLQLGQYIGFHGNERIALVLSGKFDSDGFGDNDASSSGDTDYAGKLNPKQKTTLKKLIAKGMNAKMAYRVASNVKSKAS